MKQMMKMSKDQELLLTSNLPWSKKHSEHEKRIDEILKEIDSNFIKCSKCRKYLKKEHFSISKAIIGKIVDSCNKCIQISDFDDETPKRYG